VICVFTLEKHQSDANKHNQSKIRFKPLLPAVGMKPKSRQSLSAQSNVLKLCLMPHCYELWVISSGESPEKCRLTERVHKGLNMSEREPSSTRGCDSGTELNPQSLRVCPCGDWAEVSCALRCSSCQSNTDTLLQPTEEKEALLIRPWRAFLSLNKTELLEAPCLHNKRTATFDLTWPSTPQKVNLLVAPETRLGALQTRIHISWQSF